MSLNERMPSCKAQGGAAIVSTSPGKIFLLGEYAVLAERPALVAAVGPRFGMSRGLIGTSTEFHPQSPSGRLLAYARKKGVDLGAMSFVDPMNGAGGFGASTAQFALLYLAFSREQGVDASAWGARKLYRELMRDEPLPPSGADLIAQWVGGVTFFDPSSAQVSKIDLRAVGQHLLVFSASNQSGRKVATHTHLQSLARRGFPSLEDQALIDELASITDQGAKSCLAGQVRGFGAALGSYGAALRRAGLECEAATRDREALGEISGVIGVKGAGALQADALIVMCETLDAQAHVIEAAQARNLKLVCRGITDEPGTRWETL